MPVCPKCHRFKTKKVFARHKRTCIPSKADLQHYIKSKSSKHPSECDCKRCRKKREKK